MGQVAHDVRGRQTSLPSRFLNLSSRLTRGRQQQPLPHPPSPSICIAREVWGVSPSPGYTERASEMCGWGHCDLGEQLLWELVARGRAGRGH